MMLGSKTSWQQNPVQLGWMVLRMDAWWLLRMNTWKYSIVLLIIFPVLASCDEVSPLSQGHCPEGWVDGSFVDLGCLYFNHTEYMTWLDCLKYCQAFSWNDTAAVEIITAEVNNYLRKIILANTSKY